MPVLAMAIMLFASWGCISDDVTTDASAQPEFSTDTLRLGTVITQQESPTFSMRVYNRNSRIITISSVRMAGGESSRFNLNVDGMTGSEVRDVEIRPNDSIYVFVDANLTRVGDSGVARIEDHILFTTNGREQRVTVTADAQDVERLRSTVISTDTRWEPTLPRMIFDSLVVAPGATLTIEAGTRLMMHDKARIVVRGTLRTEGTPQLPVTIGGDRTGNVVASIPFDIMSGQWHGMSFMPSSTDNRLSHTTIANTIEGVDVTDADLRLENCRLRNSRTSPLRTTRSAIIATGCEIADGADGAALLDGGQYTFNHCTFTNYYVFAPITGAVIRIGKEPTTLRIANSIIYGSGADLSPTDLSDRDISFTHCLLRSNGTDDANFIDTLWGLDPIFRLDRKNYVFDYRLADTSPALNAAIPTPDGLPTPLPYDYYGIPRRSLGAYQ